MAAKFTKGDEIAMRGTVTLVHEEEYGRRRVTIRLEGFDYLTLSRTSTSTSSPTPSRSGRPVQAPAVRR